jgi:C4-dicarboxylate transporter DctM subunit
VRLLWNSGKNASARLAALLLCAVFLALALWPPAAPETMTAPALAVLVLATLLGAPVFVTLGGAALILFWGDGLPISSVPIAHYQQVTPALLPAIPLFTLAGYFLAEGGASRRLIRVFQTLAGHLRGGPAIAAVLVCAFFTSFTGASGVTILALGGLLLPVLLASGYSEKNALGLLTSGGSLGLLWPPCLPMILYAIIAKIDIKEVFLGGLLPGLLLVVLTAAWGISRSPRGVVADRSFSLQEARLALWDAKWELLLPVVALTALFGGFATTVEAASLTAVYAFVVEVFIYRDLRIKKDVLRVLTECALLIGGVLLILGVALGFTNYLIDALVPDLLLEWAQRSIHSPYVFLLALNLLLIVVGCLMDIYSAIVVVVPIIVPMGLAFGISPVHLGIIFLANLELGYLTPPVGMNLFLSSYRFNRPMPEIMRSIVPILLVLLAGVLLITYLPPLSTLLPQHLK